MPEHFSIRDLSVSLSGTPILEQITYSVKEPGHMIALLGPNGSGKTTLLRSICWEIPHDGEIRLNGTDLSGLPPKKLASHISYIPQQSGISISMSVLDVVLMGFYSRLRLLAQPTGSMREEALRALSLVGMADFSDRDYLTLSGGEKQLVILARTLIEDTTLLLFDEPDSSLDLGNKYRMLRLISQMVRKADAPSKKSALICLHDPVLALNFCDTLLLLKNGRLIHPLHPAGDPLSEMEQAFSEIYGPIRLIEFSDPQFSEQKRRILLPIP